MLYPLKLHAHYFTVFIYLETWRGANIGIFNHFTYLDVVKVWTHWYMYTLYRSPADDRRDRTSSYYQLKKIFCITPWWVLVFDFGISTNKGRVPIPGKLGNFLEDQEKLGKFVFFGKSQGKVREENFSPCKFFTFKKTICMQKSLQLNCIWQSVVYMMLLFASNINMIWYCQSFLF